MNNKYIFFATFFLILAVNLFGGLSAHAATIDKPCALVEPIFARGSGAKLDDTDKERVRFFGQIDSRLEKVSRQPYNLGSEKYDGHQYPADSVGGWSFLTGIGATVSAGGGFAYGNSVKQGVNELQYYIKQRHAKCASAGTWYVLGGYSQGAQVIGQALEGIDKKIRDRIIFVGLFGDPKLHYPEGEGIYPDACRGKNLSAWRRAASNCHLDNGMLKARKPYLPEDMKNKTGLWCYARDTICDFGATGINDGHGKYKEPGRAIDEAALEAALRLSRVLPAAESIKIDIGKKHGSKTTGSDTVFVIDSTGSMSSRIDKARAFARSSADKLKSQNGRVALVEYRDQGDSFTARILSKFDDPYSSFTSALDGISVNGGGDTPEATLHALMTAFNGLAWKDGATKAAVVLTDASFHNPDQVDGSTVASVAKRSLEIDPVNVYPVVPTYETYSYQELAEATSGQVIVDDGDTVGALEQAITKIKERPVPLLKNTEYMAQPGQSITFDASDSYVIDAKITKYEWDFDGDGTFETTTSEPVIDHTYSTPFEGVMQVRTSADNGTVANMSAIVRVATITPPALPDAPKNFKHTITSTQDNKSTVKVTWDNNPAVSRWLLRINDMPVGFISASQTTIELTDIERGEDVTVSLAGADAELRAGSYATTVIPRINTPTNPPQPPITSTCTQANIFIRTLCKAIALAKIVIHGVLTYFLPWEV